MKNFLIPLLFAFCALLISPQSSAGTEFSVTDLTVDGQTVKNLNCNLDEGGFMPLLQVVAGLAAQKDALKACGQMGEVEASWVWTPQAGEVLVKNVTEPGKNACLIRALKKTSGPRGRCSGLLVF